MITAYRWADIIGHSQTISMLRRMLQSGDIQHAMLFTGPDGVGKVTVAKIMAAGILCENGSQGEACGVCGSCQMLARGGHPDLYQLSPEGSSIKIDQIRSMQREMAMSPCHSQKRVCIIETAETMTDQAANSLLKVLEEPPAYLVFILTASQRYRLLDTVVSRCRLFPFHPVSPGLIADTLTNKGVEERKALTAARLSGGRIGTAHTFAGTGGLDARDKAVAILSRLSSAKSQNLLDIAGVLYEKEDKTAAQLMPHLSALIRDLAVLKTAKPQQLVFNIDIIEQLAVLAENWSEDALSGSYAELRQAERAIAGNANARLTSEALIIQLSELYKGGKPVANSSGSPV